MEIAFANPSYLWFIAAIPLLVLAHFISLRFSTRKALVFANFRAIEKVTGKRILSKNYILLSLRIVTFFLIILSVSGIAIWYDADTSESDFMLAIDASGSMLADDYQPNRLESAKSAANIFVDSIEGFSNVGVVSFAGVSFMKQSSTDDMSKVRKAIENISIELAGGTAIGSAIITSVNLFTDPVRPKVVILLTDGQNNVGPTVDEAILHANDNHVTVYTVGIGTDSGSTLSEINTTFVSRLDSETLEKIAYETGGKYYMAANETDLEEIYEKIAVSGTKKVHFNLSLLFLVVVIVIMFSEWVLVNTKYRTLP